MIPNCTVHYTSMGWPRIGGGPMVKLAFHDPDTCRCEGSARVSAAGCILIDGCVGRIELSVDGFVGYVGLAPAYRGRGLGRHLHEVAADLLDVPLLVEQQCSVSESRLIESLRQRPEWSVHMLALTSRVGRQ